MIDTVMVLADTLATATVNEELTPILVGVNEPWYVTHYVELIFIALAAIKAVLNLQAQRCQIGLIGHRKSVPATHI